MENREGFDYVVNFRIFGKEKLDMDLVVRYAEDKDGYRKYGSKSHFVRSAVMKLLREEVKKLPRTTGRPKDYEDEAHDG